MKRSSVHKLATAAVWSTLFLVTFGGYTRGSGSGYGCKDRWPLCEDGLLGGYLPRLEPEMLIEWTHRWIAMLVGILALMIVFAAFKARLDRRWVLIPSIAAAVAIGIQAWLGRLVVKGDLARDLVVIHLIGSMVIVALFVIIAVSTRKAEEGPHLLERDWSRQLAFGAIAVLVVIILGGFVYNIYVPGWPLVNGEWIPDVSNISLLTIHWLHRMATAAVFIYLVFLVWRGAHVKRPHSEALFVIGAMALYALNIALGLVHVVTKVELSWVIALHLGIGGTVWAALVAATFLSFHDPR
ncbi:MAG: heme A synthase [Acidimicrobiia bacterium]